jgi:hypothetical protein
VAKVAQICEISGNFLCFLPGNKDSNPCLKDPDYLSPAKKGQRVGSLNPNPWIRNNTSFLCQICKILADLKVVWWAKNISGGLPISGGFDQFCMGLFLSGGFWRF